MGIFSEWRTNRQLRQEIEVLTENYTNSQHHVAELMNSVNELTEMCRTKQYVIDNRSDAIKRLRQRNMKLQKIVNQYKEKYGDLDPKKEERRAPQPTPLPENKERKQDHDPYPNDI